MKVCANHQRLRSLLAALALSAGLTGLLVPAATAAAAAASAAGTKHMSDMEGWMRLAHLSPNSPAVDVYLYSVGDPSATLVLHHVAYGTVSSYVKIAPGEYTVAMRGAGAATSSQPVLSTTVHVVAGGAYTVAGMGTASALRLQVLRDRLTTPRGKILIRVIQASLRQHLVTVTAGREVLARNLAFGQLTSYRVTNPGTWTFRAVGRSERTSQAIRLTPDCIHTIVILDDPGHLRIDDLLDAAGSMAMPMGSVPTGLGGTAPRPPASAQPWLLTIAAGGLLALAGGIGIRRARQRPEHGELEGASESARKRAESTVSLLRRGGGDGGRLGAALPVAAGLDRYTSPGGWPRSSPATGARPVRRGWPGPDQGPRKVRAEG